MIEPLNDWLSVTLARAKRLVEDSDRKARAEAMFSALIRRVHTIATATAIRATPPKLERYVNEEGVTLMLEWYDQESMWHLYFCVQRNLGEKPVTMLNFYGNPKAYGAKDPTDDDVRKALHDYFEEWKP